MRAPALLIALAAAAAAAVVWLLTTAPTPSGGAATEPGAVSVPAPPPAPVGPATAAPEPRPRAEAAGPGAPARAAAPAAAPTAVAVPRTAQALQGRVVLPGGDALRFTDVVARAVDADGAAGPTAVAGPDGRLVVELERPLRAGFLEVGHPALVPTRLGPLDVGAGERRGFGLVRLEPGELRTVRVFTPDGVPAEAARVWVLPPAGRAAGPLQPTLTDREGRAAVVLPVGAAGLFVRHRDRALRLATLPPRSEPEVRIELEDGAPLAGTVLAGTALAGTVLDRATGEGLSGARVELLFGNALLFAERTDAAGTFDLGRGYDAELSLRLSAEGFAPRRIDGPAGAGLGVERPVYPLGPAEDAAFAAALRGADAAPRSVRLRAVDPEGEPLAGARFELHARPVAESLRWVPSDANPPRLVVEADADGGAELALPPTLVDDVVVRAPGRTSAILRGLGRRSGRTVEVALDPGVDLVGRVLVPDGRPVPGCPFDLQVGADRVRATTDDEGWFRLTGLPRAAVRLQARAPLGFEHLGQSAPVEVGLGAGEPPPVTLTLEP